MESLKVWLSNTKSFHHRIMARYLRRRGWVVFYLEEQARACNGDVRRLIMYEPNFSVGEVLGILERIIEKYPELVVKPDPKLIHMVDKLVEGVCIVASEQKHAGDRANNGAYECSTCYLKPGTHCQGCPGYTPGS